MAIVGEIISDEEKEKQERIKRQKEGAKVAKMAEKKTAHIPRQKGGERVVDLSAQVLAEAEAVEKKAQQATAESVSPKEEKTTKGGRAKQASTGRSKIYKAAKSKVDPLKRYNTAEGLKLLREISYAKMGTTVELHLNLSEKISGVSVDLPFATGKSRRIAIADDETIAKIEKGQIDFDVLFSSPEQMPKLVKLARVLGPRGLMPNPKDGTVVNSPTQAAEKMAKSSSITFRTDKDSPVLHTVVGKLTQKDEELLANIKAILAAFGPKLTKVTFKSTMSPGIKLELS